MILKFKIQNWKFKILILRGEEYLPLFSFSTITRITMNICICSHFLRFSVSVFELPYCVNVYQFSGTFAVILYCFQCFYGIKFQYGIYRVPGPRSIIGYVLLFYYFKCWQSLRKKRGFKSSSSNSVSPLSANVSLI